MQIIAGSLSLMWLVVLFLCIVIEIATMGLTTIWFAGGAFVAVLLSLVKVPLSIQFIAFILVSGVLLVFTRPIAIQYFNKGRIKTNTESLIGQQAIVTTEIDNLKQTGRITIQGKEWTARTVENGVTIMQGAVVIVRAIDGVKLMVEEASQTAKTEQDAKASTQNME